MTKRANSKYKICRQTGENLWGRPIENKIKKFNTPENNKKKKRVTLSEYAIRLQAKQKLKKYYGNITEKQFYNLYKKASNHKGKVGESLITLLERRLDSVIYRMNFVPTFHAARQLINHGHILVNGRKVNIPSYLLREGDIIEVTKKFHPTIRKNILNCLESKHIIIDSPSYLEVNYKIMSGIFLYTPSIKEIPYVVEMNPTKVIEFYSAR